MWGQQDAAALPNENYLKGVITITTTAASC